MASKYWIKLYIEILDDPKMGRMPDRLWRRTVELFLLAGEFSEDGTLPEIKDMSWRLRVNEDVLSDDLELLTTYGIVQRSGVSYIISKFAERQSPVSDGERNKRMRERKQKQQYYGDETVTNLLRNVTVADTNCNVDTESYTDTDTELINDSAREKEFSSVWEKETGTPISNAYQFFQMLDEFKKVGVTPEIYRQAIQEQKQSNYAVNSPTSVKTWAIGMVTQKRDQRNLSGNGKRPAKITSDDNERIAREVMDEYLANQRR